MSGTFDVSKSTLKLKRYKALFIISVQHVDVQKLFLLSTLSSFSLLISRTVTDKDHTHFPIMLYYLSEMFVTAFTVACPVLTGLAGNHKDDGDGEETNLHTDLQKIRQPQEEMQDN
ncbi:Hypothetical predicted protein [Scomber scombrus]|uniref:Uncharacterized protein n=1 Tax=Scomber scombrus TaxID=13677 RepID=A0AAV1PFX9_SCOSC